MSHLIWRIAVETPSYTAVDMSGTGAKITGGRWNSAGVAMVYTASSVALAALEALSHLRTGGLPLNRFVVKIEVPDDVWDRRQEPSLPAGWNAVPHGITSIAFGDKWVKKGGSVVLCVPSVIVPDEMNYLINPAHADVGLITAQIVRRFEFDPRFFS